MDNLDGLCENLRNYFATRSDIAMAFLFGSAAREEQTVDSDLDIAVYFYPKTKALEWEEETEFPSTDEVWGDIDSITSSNTDLVVLNRAPATLAYAVLNESRSIIIKDTALYWRFFLTISSAAEDFRQFAREYWEIKHRSRSLSDVDRDRLLRIVDFLRNELADVETFTNLSREVYLRDSNIRRNVERWVENIVNASIDIGKVLLASSEARIPQTYREILSNLNGLSEFDPAVAEKLAGFSKLRNILAYEYMDIRWTRISAFVQEALPGYEYLATYTEKLLSAGGEQIYQIKPTP